MGRQSEGRWYLPSPHLVLDAIQRLLPLLAGVRPFLMKAKGASFIRSNSPELGGSVPPMMLEKACLPDVLQETFCCTGSRKQQKRWNDSLATRDSECLPERLQPHFTDPSRIKVLCILHKEGFVDVRLISDLSCKIHTDIP
jgi:hypothetical protein